MKGKEMGNLKKKVSLKEPSPATIGCFKIDAT
jgi:hypothetical protein